MGPCNACRDGVEVFPFTMAFQPIVDIVERRIDGYEALVRGPANEGAASVLNQVDETNRYKFDQACRTKAISLASRLGMDRQLSINFFPNAVYEPKACIRSTLEAASRWRFPLDRLTFEIIETEDIAEDGHLKRIIDEYRRHGFQIALDDFATGYSGLARLAELRPDIVKIDRVLIGGCDTDTTRLAIITSIIALGAEIGIKIVLEGVERPSEVEALRDAGGRYLQGFYFGRPLFEGIASDGEVFAQTRSMRSVSPVRSPAAVSMA